jgi:hypothetical protein
MNLSKAEIRSVFLRANGRGKVEPYSQQVNSMNNSWPFKSLYNE